VAGDGPDGAARQLVLEQCDYDGPLAPDDDIFRRVGLTGDDVQDFMQAFAARFDIDTSGYLWYFHTEEEGFNIGGALFRSPDKRVTRISVTPRTLADAITRKTWPVAYPDHDVPEARPDRVVNRLVFVAVLAVFAFLLGQRLAG